MRLNALQELIERQREYARISNQWLKWHKLVKGAQNHQGKIDQCFSHKNSLDIPTQVSKIAPFTRIDNVLSHQSEINRLAGILREEKRIRFDLGPQDVAEVAEVGERCKEPSRYLNKCFINSWSMFVPVTMPGQYPIAPTDHPSLSPSEQHERRMKSNKKVKSCLSRFIKQKKKYDDAKDDVNLFQ